MLESIVSFTYFKRKLLKNEHLSIIRIIFLKLSGELMKKIILFGTISVLLILSGCASRPPNTISTYMPGDADRSCSSIMHEMSNIENEMNRKWGEKNNQTGANVALGVAGFFLIVPWFFMDLSGAEKTEWEAYKKRYEYLNILLTDKGCSPYISPNATVIKDGNTTKSAQ